MKKIIMGLILSSACLSTYAGVNYQSRAECLKAMDVYIAETQSLPEELSFEYWGWFQGFKRVNSHMRETCSDGACTRLIDMGGCGAAENQILFNLIKPQLEEEIARMQAKQPSLSDVKTKVICQYKAGTTPITQAGCKLQ
ncbi:hypothetical protein [Legionella impletisoli]|uniref:Uncharacterized protein n=1 Tax=Legionella impletisoli TaxID=343510 RepID=A0A917JVB4_9GAMM|nr:hypothetical protein [Legionella impletisoli]GGI86318.1 hypothetical protein GCM10007966_13680 [Legionella impletisoli]